LSASVALAPSAAATAVSTCSSIRPTPPLDDALAAQEIADDHALSK
jgi:hypothetical protein